MSRFRPDEIGRIVGSVLVVLSFFIVVHVDTKVGAGLHLVADGISLPFFIRTRAFDVVVMMMFLLSISLSKFIV
mgnify:CR=1 FL=1